MRIIEFSSAKLMMENDHDKAHRLYLQVLVLWQQYGFRLETYIYHDSLLNKIPHPDENLSQIMLDEIRNMLIKILLQLT